MGRRTANLSPVHCSVCGVYLAPGVGEQREGGRGHLRAHVVQPELRQRGQPAQRQQRRVRLSQYYAQRHQIFVPVERI